jgi:hypothetical protein
VSQQLVPPPWTGGHELSHSESVVQEPQVAPPLELPLLPLEPLLLPLLPLELPLPLPLSPLELPLLPLELPLLPDEALPSLPPPSVVAASVSPKSSWLESPEPQAAATLPTTKTANKDRTYGSISAPVAPYMPGPPCPFDPVFPGKSPRVTPTSWLSGDGLCTARTTWTLAPLGPSIQGRAQSAQQNDVAPLAVAPPMGVPPPARAHVPGLVNVG